MKNEYVTTAPPLPVLRFSSFTGTWRKEEIKELFIEVPTTSNVYKDDVNNLSGPAKNIQIHDIVFRFNEYCNVAKQKLSFLNADAPFNIEKYKEKAALRDKDIVIVANSWGAQIGRCVEIIGASDDIIFAGTHTLVLRPRKSSLFSPGYLGAYFNSTAYQHQLYSLPVGLIAKHIPMDDWRRTTIAYPPSFEEQQKIGAFFLKLDELIKLNPPQSLKLKHLKNYLLQMMFPRD